MNVATTILQQLGGAKFLAMTGAKNLIGSDTSLSFRVPMATKDGSNAVTITLTPMDDYIVEFSSIRGMKRTVRTVCDMVYAENLKSVFTSVTGLLTSLGTLGKAA